MDRCCREGTRSIPGTVFSLCIKVCIEIRIAYFEFIDKLFCNMLVLIHLFGSVVPEN